MKKVFTLLALLAMFLGANAQGGKWEKVYEIDYTTYSAFPFYVMGYAPSFDGSGLYDAPTTQKLWRGNESDFPGEDACQGTVSVNGTDFYVQETGENQWRQYFIADNIPTKIDGKYKVVAKVKATAACNINVNMGWGWGSGQQAGMSVSIPEGSDFQEVEWQYEGIGGSSCNLVAQPGTVTETLEWQSVTVYEWQKEGQRPKVWLEDIENGDAEKSWDELGLADVKFNDQENNYKVCAWGKERMVNTRVDENGNTVWDPFPATIEEEEGNPSNHVFVVHGKPATTEGDPSAWDNQFWIQSKHSWKEGTALKIKFRYKCDYAGGSVKTNTQIHKQNPSDYLHWAAVGDITFTNDWQTFDGTMTIDGAMANGWSIAFNLNPNVKDAVNFYFDDLSWQYLKLDEGFFASGINTNTTKEYDDLDNAIQFEEGESADGTPCLVAVVGEKGNSATYVDQLMVSTTRGDDAAFKGATLKPVAKVKNDPDDWQEYAASGNAKLDLPGLGVWKIYLDTEYKSIAFEMLEGTMYEEPDPVAIITNPSVIVVNALERQPTATEQPADESAGIAAGTGQPWDNQLFIKANRILKTGEETVIEFDYVADKEARTTTQCHAQPGDYRGGGVGEVLFTPTEQHFKADFVVPSHEKEDIQTMVFNLAEIKDACNYTIKNVKWYLKYDEEGKTLENLINENGQDNFSSKVVGGSIIPTDPTGISSVVNDKKVPNAIYNLAGQRVSKEYKGIVIKNGAKYIAK